MKYTVMIPLPERTIYHIEADYPEKAKREAATIHRNKLPRLPIAEIVLLASCYKDSPRTSGGRHKSQDLVNYIMNRPCLK